MTVITALVEAILQSSEKVLIFTESLEHVKQITDQLGPLLDERGGQCLIYTGQSND